MFEFIAELTGKAAKGIVEIVEDAIEDIQTIPDAFERGWNGDDQTTTETEKEKSRTSSDL